MEITFANKLVPISYTCIPRLKSVSFSYTFLKLISLEDSVMTGN